MINKRFTWEYSNYDSTGEIHDWKRQKCLITDYLQKYEIEEWCQELNKIVDENAVLNIQNKKLKQEIEALKMEIAELRESEKDNYNVTDGLW